MADAVTKKAVARLRVFTDFLAGVTGKTGFMGGAITEVGIPQARADSSPPAAYVADVPLWQALYHAWYQHADNTGLWVTPWASGPQWGDYNLGMHTNGTTYTYPTGTNITKMMSPGGIDVVEAHPAAGGYRRGVNLAGPEFGHKTAGFSNATPGGLNTGGALAYFFPTAGDIAVMAARGITTVRLPISWERVQPTLLGALNATYLGYITAVANACSANGVGLVIDVHNYARYEYWDTGSGTKKVLVLRAESGIDLNSPGPTGEDAGKIGPEYLIDLWRRLSDTYRDHAGVVAYELMNEPHDVAPSTGGFSGTTLNNWNDGTAQDWAADYSGATVAHTTTTPYEGSGALRITKTTGAAGAFHLQRAERGSVSGSGNIVRGRVRLNGTPTGTWYARWEWQNVSYAWQSGATTALVAGTWVEVSCDFSAAPIAADARNLCVQIHCNDPGAGQSVSADLDLLQRGTAASSTGAQAWETITQAVLTDLRTRSDNTARRDTKMVLVPGHGWNVLGWGHAVGWLTEPAGLEGQHRYVTHHYFDSTATGGGEGEGVYQTADKRYADAQTYALAQGFTDDTGAPAPVWRDEFTSLSLSTDAAPTLGTWRSRGYESLGTLATGYKDYAGLSWNTSPVQHPAQNPFSVSGSVLTIKAQRTPAGVVNVEGAEWMGGYLVTNHDLAPTPLRWRYGYFECRARWPNPVRGMFPAIWMFNGVAWRSDGKEGAELDLFEIFGESDGKPWAGGWHNKPTPGASGNAGYFDDDTTGWHRYGLEWTATAVRWFKDGVQRAELTGANATWFATADLGFRLDYVMDPSWETPGSPLRSTSTDPPPGTEPRMEVDYVRVFAAKPDPLPTGSDDPLAVAAATAFPVVFSSVLAEPIDATTQRISWTTDVPTINNRVFYSRDRSYALMTALDETIRTSHAFTLTNLLPDTPYHFKVGGIYVPPDAVYPLVSKVGAATGRVNPAVDMRFLLQPAVRSAAATTTGATFRAGSIVIIPAPVSAGHSMIDPFASIQTATPYQEVVMTDSPIGYWRLGETAGTIAADASGNARHGTYVGNPALGQPGALVESNRSVLFDSVGDYVSVAHNAAFNLTGNLTLEAWVYPSADRSTYREVLFKGLISGDSSNTFEFRLEATSGRPLFQQVTGSGVQPVTGTAAPPLDAWSHIAVTKSGTTVTHYLNGAANGTGTISATGVTTSTSVTIIGMRGDGGGRGLGRIDEVVIYNTALAAVRLLAHYNAGITPP